MLTKNTQRACCLCSKVVQCLQWHSQCVLLQCDYEGMCCGQIKPSSPRSCNTAPEMTLPLLPALVCMQHPCLMQSLRDQRVALCQECSGVIAGITAADSAALFVWHSLARWGDKTHLSSVKWVTSFWEELRRRIYGKGWVCKGIVLCWWAHIH